MAIIDRDVGRNKVCSKKLICNNNRGLDRIACVDCEASSNSPYLSYRDARQTTVHLKLCAYADDRSASSYLGVSRDPATYTWTRDWVHMGTRLGTHGHETRYTWTRDWVHMDTRLGTHGHETGYTWARD